MNKKKILPYSADHIRARRSGLVTARREIVVVVDRWSKFSGLERVVLPPGEHPEEYHGDFLRSIGAVVAWRSDMTTGARIREVSRAILAANPRYLLLLDCKPDATDKRRLFWVKSERRGVEANP